MAAQVEVVTMIFKDPNFIGSSSMAVVVVVAAPIVFEDTAPMTLNLNVNHISNIYHKDKKQLLII